MNHVTSIGLDVHARSITAVALDSATGEVRSQRFENSPAEVASWILSFKSPKAVYESGVTGFYLVRALRKMGVDCIVGAVSKMHKPASDKRKKNDRNDAEFLARQLLAHNIVEVFVPDVECEGAQALSRTLEDIRDDLTRAKHRLTHLLIRWGHIWNERTPEGKRRGTWTRAHWEWLRAIELPDMAAQEALDYYISEVRHIEAQKKALEKRVASHASKPRWRERVEALRCLKGIETATAFSLVVETGAFSRFESARAYSSWIGLVPSEYSSGEHIAKGSITKAGNSHLRKLLVEASWHYTRATKERKRSLYDDTVPVAISNHAALGVKRLVERREHFTCDLRKRPVVANVATARELACWIWALGRMSEGTLSQKTDDHPITVISRDLFPIDWSLDAIPDQFYEYRLADMLAERLFHIEGARIQPQQRNALTGRPTQTGDEAANPSAVRASPGLSTREY